MRGVGPAGRWFTTSKVRGRSAVVMKGGRRRVGGRTLMRKDWVGGFLVWCFLYREEEVAAGGGGGNVRRISESPKDAR